METLNLNGITVEALSIGGVESCYRFPKLRISMDIGRCPAGSERYPILFLTHSHIDHSAGLPYYVSMRSLKKMPPPTVYCPAECRHSIEAMLKAWTPLDADAHRCNLIGVEPGDEIVIKNDYFVRAFASPHRVPVRGYTIFKNFRRLRDDLVGLDASEIAAIARSGEEVNQRIQRAEFCFPGDSRIEIVEAEETVRTARVLLLESTFVGPKISVDQAIAAGHIHLDQIAERADLFENEIIVLSHFSQRYTNAEIRHEAQKALPEKLLSRVRFIFPHRQ